jgi:hypothetical protein
VGKAINDSWRAERGDPWGFHGDMDKTIKGWRLAGSTRILRGGWGICIELEMRHLFRTKMEKAAWLLLE